MNFKHLFLTTIFALTSLVSFSQKGPIAIHLNEDSELYINDIKIDENTNHKKLKSILGEPSSTKEYPTGKKRFKYDDLGLTLNTYNKQIIFVGANLNWDGDDNFPETSFPGVVKIENHRFSKSDTKAFIPKILVHNISCPLEELCFAKNEAKNLTVIIGFKNDKITQVGFEMLPTTEE